MSTPLRLGMNIDHVATVRNARGGDHPDPIRAAEISVKAGANGITAHLREDRRHIRDADIYKLKELLEVPLNMEMAATDEMVEIALDVKPHAVCIVPEKREEVTTEGGLNVVAGHNHIKPAVLALTQAGIRVSLFIEANKEQLDAAVSVGAPVVEIHTGRYCEAKSEEREGELIRIQEAADFAEKVGLECHAGHGLNFETVGDIAAIPNIVELNIGHFLIGEAIFLSLEQSIIKMRHIMDEARNHL